jgi:hypothetical protein
MPEWRWVAGFEARYEVSDTGMVRSWVPWKGTPVPRLLRPGIVGNGYRCVSVGAHNTRLVHHLVAEAFHGARPEGLIACHNNGDSQDNRAENIRWDTYSANILDSVEHGTNVHAAKTHCLRGHEFTEANTYRKLGKSGRWCRACRNDRNRRIYNEKKAAV